jgi:hypothetical protein
VGCHQLLHLLTTGVAMRTQAGAARSPKLTYTQFKAMRRRNLAYQRVNTPTSPLISSPFLLLLLLRPTASRRQPPFFRTASVAVGAAGRIALIQSTGGAGEAAHAHG